MTTRPRKRRARQARKRPTRVPPTSLTFRHVDTGHLGVSPYRRETSWGAFSQGFGRRLAPAKRTAKLRPAGKGTRRTIKRKRRDSKGRFR